MSLRLAVNTNNTFKLKEIISNDEQKQMNVFLFFSRSKSGEGRTFLMSTKQSSFVLGSAMLWVYHSSLLRASLAHLTGFFWCCFVAMVTKCYSMHQGVLYRPRPLPLHVTETPFTISAWKQCVPQLSDSYFNLISHSWMPSDTRHGSGNTFNSVRSLLRKQKAAALFK